MRTLSVLEAANFIREHNIEPTHWGCGYILTVVLELDYSILVEGDDWKQLENILFYNA